jgi:hypothetical protein
MFVGNTVRLHGGGRSEPIKFLDHNARSWRCISRNAEKDIHMNDSKSFSTSIYEDQAHLAERELASFISGVTELFGPEQARVSAQDWLDEAELMDAPPRSTARDWRAVTIAASARLARRIDAVRYRQKSPSKLTNTKVSPILSSNCFSSVLLF